MGDEDRGAEGEGEEEEEDDDGLDIQLDEPEAAPEPGGSEVCLHLHMQGNTLLKRLNRSATFARLFVQQALIIRTREMLLQNCVNFNIMLVAGR